jgi:NitT/TauT family transport system ATP-binding protein
MNTLSVAAPLATAPARRDSTAATSTAATLTVSGVSKVFATGTAALRDVSLQVRPGELVAIVGPSGCGKSTLLRLVAGLSAPTQGTIEASHSRLEFVFQDPTLLPWRTVQGNLELVGTLIGLRKRERTARAAQLLELTGLGGFERHLPRQLSGGMKMRVSLARALMASPDLFLLDEPFGALDEITRQRLDNELLRLHASEGFAALFVTHNVLEAVYLSNRVIVMSPRPGRIAAEVEVDLPFPRSSKTRFSPGFTAVTREVSARLEEVSG